MTGTNTKFPEPYRISDNETRSYLNELIRNLRDFDSNIFSQDTGLIFEAARKRPFIEVSSAYTMGARDNVILVDASASSTTITLPLALDGINTFYDIKKIDQNAATVVSVEGSGPEIPIILNGADRPSVTVYSDGNNYWII